MSYEEDDGLSFLSISSYFAVVGAPEYEPLSYVSSFCWNSLIVGRGLARHL